MKYRNPRRQATIAGWPSGTHRVTAQFLIEAHPKHGERAVRQTTGSPKKSTYARKARIVDGDDGRTYILQLTDFGHISVMKGDMKFNQETVFDSDPRYAELLTLFSA